MNKKSFIGATVITATTVGVLVYYRHKLLAQAGKTLVNLDNLLHPLAEDAKSAWYTGRQGIVQEKELAQ